MSTTGLKAFNNKQVQPENPSVNKYFFHFNISSAIRMLVIGGIACINLLLLCLIFNLFQYKRPSLSRKHVLHQTTSVKEILQFKEDNRNNNNFLPNTFSQTNRIHLQFQVFNLILACRMQTLDLKITQFIVQSVHGQVIIDQLFLPLNLILIN